MCLCSYTCKRCTRIQIKKPHLLTQSFSRARACTHTAHTHIQPTTMLEFFYFRIKRAHIAKSTKIPSNFLLRHTQNPAASKYNKRKNDTRKKRELEIWWKPFCVCVCVSWYSWQYTLYKCKQMKWKKPFFNECWKWKHSSALGDKLEKWSGKEDEITWTENERDKLPASHTISTFN